MRLIDCDLPRNEQGRFYHINCGPGDIAPYVITCGDPARAEKIAKCFEQVEVERRNREFVTYTGLYRGIRTTVMGTGIGGGPTAMAIVEASQCAPEITFMRLGTCGAIQDDVSVGDLIVTERAIRDESTSAAYARPDVEAVAHPSVLAALMEAARRLGHRCHRGVTCTTSDFYAGQARSVPGFPTVDPHKLDRLRGQGVLNVEMEMSVYLTLAQVTEFKMRAGGLCVVLCNRTSGAFASSAMMDGLGQRCVETGLLAVEILSGNDAS